MLVVSVTVGLPPRVLPVIQAVEGGALSTVHKNTNSTVDLGIMQINSTWIPFLAKRTKLSPEEVRRRLINEPCFNIAASALILRGYLRETDGNLVQAIGYYHSHTPTRATAYALLAEHMALRMFGGEEAAK